MTDKSLEDAGTFYCSTCLVDRLVDRRSPDPRYCQDCYDFLLEEVELLEMQGRTRRPAWAPKP